MIVAKVGGSLFDLPQLGPALARWAAARSAPVLFVPGGGGFTDVIRQADKVHGIGEEAAHWLALRTLSVTAHLLTHLLPDAELLANPTWGELEQKRWNDPGRIYVLDPFPFFQQHDALPHRWEVTTDSLAVEAARYMNADRLVLLKSVDVPAADWRTAAERGWVDPHFPTAAERTAFPIEVVNFRRWVGEGRSG